MGRLERYFILIVFQRSKTIQGAYAIALSVIPTFIPFLMTLLDLTLFKKIFGIEIGNMKMRICILDYAILLSKKLANQLKTKRNLQSTEDQLSN